jgi:hypothetical protein
MLNKDDLRPEIVEFATPTFSMGSELDELIRVHRVGAVHSTVLICGRILHALAAEALGQLASPVVFTNLMSLYRLNLVSSPTHYWLNAIRRTANEARHIRRRLKISDAQWTLLYTEKCLEWFFCKLPRTNAIETLTSSGDPLCLTETESERRLIAAFDTKDFDPVAFAEEQLLAAISEDPDTTLLSAVIEELINHGNLETADRVLQLAESRGCFNLRIAQLRGLYWRRSHKLPQARDHMNPVFEKYASDEETAGIMAAICKELWIANENDMGSLKNAHRLYFEGWKNSGKGNTYLGINAATTALWLQRGDEAKPIAFSVQQKILNSIRTLHAIYPSRPNSFESIGMWEQLSLAEAELILENVEEARKIYGSTFERFALHQSAIDGAKNQAKKICENLKLPLEQLLD